MKTLPFPKVSQPCHTGDLQAQKKDIATLLSNHVHPNPSTSLTLTDPSGKTISLNCNTDNAAELLDLAMGFLSH
ncbi:hypothetical protein [Psychrobacter sp. AT9]|uniref:hypothetical protein n=1 Tax=Psychrobacter sp. AT9 TaxID=3242893 RepID=UPI0039A75D5F